MALSLTQRLYVICERSRICVSEVVVERKAVRLETCHFSLE